VLRIFFIGSVSLLETFYPAGAVNQLLFSGVKRMAFVADFNMAAFYGRPYLNDISAGAGE
jgi:hypothetical protein